MQDNGHIGQLEIPGYPTAQQEPPGCKKANHSQISPEHIPSVS